MDKKERYGISPTFNNIYWITDESKLQHWTIFYLTDKHNAEIAKKYLNSQENCINKLYEKTKKYKNKLQQFQNLADDYNLKIDDICKTFDDSFHKINCLQDRLDDYQQNKDTITDLKTKITQLEDELQYTKTKCANLETGYLEYQRKYEKLKQELKK